MLTRLVFASRMPSIKTLGGRRHVARHANEYSPSDRNWVLNVMDRKEFRSIKSLRGKRLQTVEFKSVTRNNKLPKPLDKLGGPRVKASPLYNVGHELKAVFVWKTAPVKEQRQLYGFLFKEVPRGLMPMVRLDYHPSHKGLHILLNCEDERDLTNRGLPGCKELAITDKALDPDVEDDRNRFIALFCERVNIELGEPGGLI